MGLNMTLEQSQAQADSVRLVSQAQIEGYQALQQAIQTFADDTENLTGKAYESAKAYYHSVLLPLAQGGQLYAEALAEASVKLPEQYQENVDTKSWSEYELLDYIQQEDNLIAQLDELHQTVSGQALSSDDKWSLQQEIVDVIRGHHANKQVYETILTNLQAYSTDSVALFADLEELACQLDRGLAQTKTCWDASSGTFTTPSDLSWATYLSTYATTKDWDLSQEERAFVHTMMTEYGFDLETARQLLTVKNGIDQQFPDSAGYSQQERDYIFLRVIGESSYDGGQWDETAGYLSEYFYSYAINNSQIGESFKIGKPLLEILQDLGLSEQEAKELNYNLRLQHEMAVGEHDNSQKLKQDNAVLYKNARNTYKSVYGSADGFDEFWDKHLKVYSNNGAGNPDFTHQAITMATHLNPSVFQWSDVYGGREHVKDLSGWEGDTTYNATEMIPSIGEDDYKADLDAVNIIGRMDKGQSYNQAMTDYYQDIHQGETSRETEFLQNENWDEVKVTVYTGLVPDEILTNGEQAAKDYIAEHYKNVSKFLERLEEAAENRRIN